MKKKFTTLERKTVDWRGILNQNQELTFRRENWKKRKLAMQSVLGGI